MMTHKIYHSLIAALIGAATTGAVRLPRYLPWGYDSWPQRRATAVSAYDRHAYCPTSEA